METKNNGGRNKGIGNYSVNSIKTKLFTMATVEPWRSIIMTLLKTLGYRDEPWARVVMNQQTSDLVSRMNHSELNVCEISGDMWSRKFPWKSYESVFYPEFDICSPPKWNKSFDLVIAEQVFEHIPYPYRAGRNVHAMLNDGGYFLLTTPFLIRIHGYPIDCTRWTEMGMKFFLSECGFHEENIKTGSWGNISCIKGNFWYWKRYHPVLHSLKNLPDHPIMVWALAHK